MPSRKYLEQLLKQEQVDICPECFKNGKREEFCRKPVVIQPENVLVCCFLADKLRACRFPGDRHKIIKEEKIEALKKAKASDLASLEHTSAR